jgi:hypothetical protein
MEVVGLVAVSLRPSYGCNTYVGVSCMRVLIFDEKIHDYIITKIHSITQTLKFAALKWSK